MTCNVPLSLSGPLSGLCRPTLMPAPFARYGWLVFGAMLWVATLLSILPEVALAQNSANGGGFSGSSQSVDGALSRLLESIDGPIRILLATICYIAAIVLIFRGLCRILQHANPRAPYLSVFGTLMCLLVGGIMITMPTQVGVFTGSLFGGETHSYSVLSYGTGESEAALAAKEVIKTALRFIQLFGLIWFISAWFNLLDASDGKRNKTIKGAVFRMVASVACINIFNLIDVTQNTLGLNIFEFT